MTTAEPLVDEPTIPVADLEPMLGDRERQCDLRRPDGQPCSRAARWIVTGRCGDCMTVRTALLCHSCRSSLVLGRVHHRVCGHPMSETRVEPL